MTESYTNEPTENPHGIKVGDKIEVILTLEVTHLDHFVHSSTDGNPQPSFTGIGFGSFLTSSGTTSYYTLELPDEPGEGITVDVQVLE